MLKYDDRQAAEPAAIRNCPVVTVAFPLASPVRNCASDNVMVLIACSSMRAAMSFEAGSATAKGAATRHISSVTIKPRRFINPLLSIPNHGLRYHTCYLAHVPRQLFANAAVAAPRVGS